MACEHAIITSYLRIHLNGSPERATKGKVAGHASVPIDLGMSPAGDGYAIMFLVGSVPMVFTGDIRF